MVDTNTADFGTVMTDEELTAAMQPETPETPEPEANDENEETPLAPENEQTEADEIDIPDEDQEESPNLKLKPKKQSFQERMNEVTAARRAAEREAETLREKLAELEARPAPEVKTDITDTGPTADDVDANGEAKYPLGEYDPLFIKDYTKHVLETEYASMKAKEAEDARIAREKEAVAEIQNGWQERLAAAQEELPDLQEKGMKLEQTFEGLNPEYGQYLAQTIMSLDHGPEVLYYLSENIDEAKSLVDAGPLKATLGLGELNSMFKTKRADPPVKVTKAPEPPSDRNRGTNGRFDTPDDTDDLSAFEKKFYGR